MSRTVRTRRTGATLLAGATIGLLALTGCGAGQVAGTSDQVSAVAGANVTVGAIAVRDAQIAYGENPVESGVVYRAGEDAPLTMTIVNQGVDADRLVSATSAWAQSITVSGTTDIAGGRAIVVEGEAATPLASASPVPVGPEEGGVAPTAGPVPTGPVPTQEAPGPEEPATLTPAATPTGVVASEGAQVVLTGLLGDVRAGETYEVVLTFERAGEVRLQVPVGATEEPREDEHGE